MSSKSKAQANLMRAAEHGATFAKAKKLRASMTAAQLHDFAVTKSKNLPRHVKKNHQGSMNRYGAMRGGH